MAMAAEKGGALSARPGASARIQHVVTGGHEGDVRYVTVVVDGTIVEQRLGQDVDADITVTCSYEVSAQMTRGELDLSAAYMRGGVKVTGDMARLLALMPVLQSPEYKSIQDEILQATEL